MDEYFNLFFGGVLEGLSVLIKVVWVILVVWIAKDYRWRRTEALVITFLKAFIIALLVSLGFAGFHMVIDGPPILQTDSKLANYFMQSVYYFTILAIASVVGIIWADRSKRSKSSGEINAHVEGPK
jgi:hypothetical protein